MEGEQWLLVGQNCFGISMLLLEGGDLLLGRLLLVGAWRRKLGFDGEVGREGLRCFLPARCLDLMSKAWRSFCCDCGRTAL